MAKTVKFLKDFAGYKKGDVSPRIDHSAATSLKARGIVEFLDEELRAELTPESVLGMKIADLEKLANEKGIDLSGDKTEKQNQFLAAYFPDYERKAD